MADKLLPQNFTTTKSIYFASTVKINLKRKHYTAMIFLQINLNIPLPSYFLSSLERTSLNLLYRWNKITYNMLNSKCTCIIREENEKSSAFDATSSGTPNTQDWILSACSQNFKKITFANLWEKKLRSKKDERLSLLKVRQEPPKCELIPTWNY